MTCIDFIVWIGQTKVYKSIDDYIKEAERLGCCRRIPQVPSWAVPEKSRVFLVHRGNHKALNRGSIFGFYILKRIEIITGKQGPDPVKRNKGRILWSNKYYEELKEAANGNKVEKKLKRNFLRDISTGKIDLGYEEPEVGDDDKIDRIRKLLKNILEEVWNEYKEWLESEYYKIVPTEQSEMAGGLGCSRRTTPGAVYLVDTLASEINDAFHRKLYEWLAEKGKEQHPGKSREQLLEILKKTENKAIYPEEGVSLFRDAHKEVLTKRAPERVIPDPLKGKAHSRGELVVFDKPYPIFQRSPYAAFRGYFRINGDQLIKQIIDGKRIPSIPYCDSIKLNKSRTKSQLATHFASELGLQKTTVNKFFRGLSELVIVELKRHKSISIPNIGRFSLSKKNAVTFRAAKRIKDRVP